METLRRWIQLLTALLANGYWAFPWTRSLYQGPLKVLCSPGLNCYSCPAATTYCPIGALQQLLLSIRFTLQSGSLYIGTYVLGCMGVLAAGLGRFICGWACPFGLFQELLYRLPGPKLSVPQWGRVFKYLFLLFFVILFPLVLLDAYGMGRPWFCKYICPAGTLEAGFPMLLLLPDLRATVGLLFLGKVTILAGFGGWSVVSSRPFCRTACPLGAFYGLFNRYSLVKLQFIEDHCTKCGACHAVCPVEIRFNETPDSRECVRCLKCMYSACRYDAIVLDVAGFRVRATSAPLSPRPVQTDQ